MFEKTVSKQTVYKGGIFDVDVHQIELANGQKSKREIVVHGPAVAIVVQRADGQFLPWFPPRRPSDGCYGGRGWCHVCVLSRQHGHL